MIVGFDLDGTLDNPSVCELAKALLVAGHKVHIITGTFSESGPWQGFQAKVEKLTRLGISLDIPLMDTDFGYAYEAHGDHPRATLHVLTAVDKSYGTEYRLRDLGLRKGDLCQRLGITLFFDDSELYCEMIPKMAGGVTPLQVH